VPDRPVLDAWVEHVRPEWIDYNGHLSEAYYVLVFGHATDAVMAQLGMTPEYLTDTATSLYTLEAHVRYLDEVPPDSRLQVRSRVIGVTSKLLWLWHEMISDGRLRASEEVLAVHVDTAAGRSSPLPAELRSRAEALLVPPPEHASRRISLGGGAIGP
jgi:acyl-CoA thioester hydrolase